MNEDKKINQMFICFYLFFNNVLLKQMNVKTDINDTQLSRFYHKIIYSTLKVVSALMIKDNK